jgi:hypothetical protein
MTVEAGTADTARLSRFERTHSLLWDLRSGLRTQGNYQIAGYVDRAISALVDALHIRDPLPDVRQLEWIESPTRSVPFDGPEVVRIWDGHGIGMRFATIIECTDGEFTLLSNPTCERFPNLEGAQAAAQSDFRARIHSAFSETAPEGKTP